MIRKTRGRILAGVAVSFVSLLGIAVVQPAAGAETVRPQAASMTVTPSSGLDDGDIVTVSGTGLQGGTVYHIGECADVGGGNFACDWPSTVHVTASKEGTLSTRLAVKSKFEGYSGPSGDPWGTVSCEVHACAIAMFNDVGDAAGVPIFFG